MATSKKTHRCFTVALKLKAVETAERSSKSEAAKLFNVDPNRIREWCAPKKGLLQKTKCDQSTKKRVDEGRRKALYQDMEEVVFDWITELRSRNVRVSRRMIMDFAKAVQQYQLSSSFFFSRLAKGGYNDS